MKANSRSCLEFLIKAGANVNHYSEQSGWQTTPLIDALWVGDYTTVELLIESGADVNAETHEETALMIAFRSNNVACVKLLLRAGAAVKTRRTTLGKNTIESYLSIGRNKNNYHEFLMLLFAAGESTRNV